jgi:hypothetical protein
MYANFFPDGLDALPFAARDLHAALQWAETKPDIRMHITSEGVRGIIEIYPPGCPLPRWCLWQSQDGRLQFDDLAMHEFALPYPTIDMALRFIASKLQPPAGQGVSRPRSL